MGFLTRFFQTRDAPTNSTSGAAYSFFMGTSAAGKSVNERSAMKGAMVQLDPSEVLHIPGLGFDGVVGYSPIAMAKNAIGLSIAAEEYGSKFYANGAAPSGVLEHSNVLKDPAKVRDSWNAAFGGSSNSHRVAVLEEGMKYTPISINPNEAQFLETRKFQIDEIARIFRVPPHMVSRYMPAIAAGNKTIAFGDFNYYWMRSAKPTWMKSSRCKTVMEAQVESSM